jgi:Eukaryotic porin
MASTEQDSTTSAKSSEFLSSLGLPKLVPDSFRQHIARFTDWHNELGLEFPGNIETVHKEVQRDVFLTNYAFSGMKADLSRNFCANPLFQVSHSFAAGSSQSPPYSFVGLYATDNVLLHCRFPQLIDVGLYAGEFGQ